MGLNLTNRMTIKRIVSFLPSATELLYEFDVQDNLFGVTHECKFPQDATLKPQVIRSVINSDELSSKEIDTMTCRLLNDGKDICYSQTSYKYSNKYTFCTTRQKCSGEDRNQR